MLRHLKRLISESSLTLLKPDTICQGNLLTQSESTVKIFMIVARICTTSSWSNFKWKRHTYRCTVLFFFLKTKKIIHTHRPKIFRHSTVTTSIYNIGPTNENYVTLYSCIWLHVTRAYHGRTNRRSRYKVAGGRRCSFPKLSSHPILCRSHQNDSGF